jgi:hypothetical protein
MSMHCPVSDVTVSHQNRRKNRQECTINSPFVNMAREVMIFMQDTSITRDLPASKAPYKKRTLVVLYTGCGR